MYWDYVRAPGYPEREVDISTCRAKLMERSCSRIDTDSRPTPYTYEDSPRSLVGIEEEDIL